MSENRSGKKVNINIGIIIISIVLILILIGDILILATHKKNEERLDQIENNIITRNNELKSQTNESTDEVEMDNVVENNEIKE